MHRLKAIQKKYLLLYQFFFLVPLLFFSCFPIQVYAQSQEAALRGFVRDAENAQPLVGANILVRSLGDTDQTRGAVAGTNGYYYIGELEQGSYAVRVSFIGYQSVHDTLNLSGEKVQYTFTANLPPSEQQLDEVVVTGEAGGATTLEAGRQNVAPKDLGRVTAPSVSGDLANYLQTLPSVVSVGDRGGQLFIRGGSPDQNIVLMDKMQIYRPFHIVGFYSVFPQDLISGAQVYAGGYPAEYNGRLSSVIDVSMRGGNHQRFEGAGTVGPFLTGVRVEGPINDNGLSFLASGRFSQIERTSPIILGEEQPLKFGDQIFKLQSTTESSKCTVTGMHSYDRGKIDLQRDDVFRWSNYGLGGRCIVFTNASNSLIDASLNTSYAKNSIGSADDPEREASIWNLRTDVDLESPLKGGHTLIGGFKARVDETIYNVDEEFEGGRNEDKFNVSFTGYLTVDLKMNKNLELNPGLSLGGSFDYGLNLEPRLRASWRPFGSADQELNAATGIYRQTIVGISDERDLGSTFTAWSPINVEQPRPLAWHAILGWRQNIGNFGLTLEGYHKQIRNLSVPIWSNFARFTTETTNADGTVWGFDLRGEYSRGPIYVYIGYGFSWTQYTTYQENFAHLNQSYHPAHDQRHSLNAIFSSDLGFANLDIRWQFGSGMPYTRPFGFDSLIELRNLQDPRDAYGTPRILFDKPYQGRLPVYHRLDVSMQRTFDLDLVNMTLKGGVINAYSRKNLFYYDLFRLRRVDQLPLIPFVAIEVAT